MSSRRPPRALAHTEPSASSSQPTAGVPGVIAAAAAEYERRCRDLERMGLPKNEAHREILDEARDVGGVIAAGETINLTLWSRRLHIPRAVLEALVLAAYRANPPPSLPRASSRRGASARPPREVPTSSAPGTPAPKGRRRP